MKIRIELYEAAGIYNMTVYKTITLLNLYNALLAIYKYTAHGVLLMNFINLIFSKKPAQLQTVSWNFLYANAMCVLLEYSWCSLYLNFQT